MISFIYLYLCCGFTEGKLAFVLFVFQSRFEIEDDKLVKYQTSSDGKHSVKMTRERLDENTLVMVSICLEHNSFMQTQMPIVPR